MGQINGRVVFIVMWHFLFFILAQLGLVLDE